MKCWGENVHIIKKRLTPYFKEYSQLLRLPKIIIVASATGNTNEPLFYPKCETVLLEFIP